MGAALEPAAPPADAPGLKLDHTVWCWGGTYQGHPLGGIFAPTDPLDFDPPVTQVSGWASADGPVRLLGP